MGHPHGNHHHRPRSYQKTQIVANEVYQLAIQGFLNSNWRENVMCFRGTGVDTNDTKKASKDLIDAWSLHIRSNFLALLPNTYILQNMMCKRVSPFGSFSSRLILESGLFSGTTSAPATTQQCCPSIFMVPAMGVKSGGKIFLPGISQGDITNNAFTAGYNTRINTFMSSMTTGFAGTLYTWQLVIFSRKLNTNSIVQSWHLSPFIGFVRKRQWPWQSHTKRPPKKV